MTTRGEIKPAPTWSDAKATLVNLDRAGLIGLLKDLHGLNPENRAFLQARLSLGADPLAPYKATIARWICPDVTRGQNTSVAKAKKAIADYRRATGLPKGMAELSVVYCEQAADLLSHCGIDDDGYFAALVRMYGQALSPDVEPVRSRERKQASAARRGAHIIRQSRLGRQGRLGRALARACGRCGAGMSLCRRSAHSCHPTLSPQPRRCR